MGNSAQAFIKQHHYQKPYVHLSQTYLPFPALEELPSPQSISVTPLDDTRLKVEWTAALNQSESGFVLQWSSVPRSGPASLHWEQMNKTARSFNLTGLINHLYSNRMRIKSFFVCFCWSVWRWPVLVALIYFLIDFILSSPFIRSVKFSFFFVLRWKKKTYCLLLLL